MTQKRHLLGIDPGALTGYALYDVDAGRLTVCTSLPFWSAAERLHEDAPFVAGVVVEDPRSIGLYARNNHLRGARRDRAARSVGEIDGQVRLWGELCGRLGLPVVFQAPSRKKKWSAQVLERITGFEGRTNEHARDAARLVYGRSVENVLLLAETTAQAAETT